MYESLPLRLSSPSTPKKLLRKSSSNKLIYLSSKSKQLINFLTISSPDPSMSKTLSNSTNCSYQCPLQQKKYVNSEIKVKNLNHSNQRNRNSNTMFIKPIVLLQYKSSSLNNRDHATSLIGGNQTINRLRQKSCENLLLHSKNHCEQKAQNIQYLKKNGSYQIKKVNKNEDILKKEVSQIRKKYKQLTNFYAQNNQKLKISENWISKIQPRVSAIDLNKDQKDMLNYTFGLNISIPTL